MDRRYLFKSHEEESNKPYRIENEEKYQYYEYNSNFFHISDYIIENLR